MNTTYREWLEALDRKIAATAAYRSKVEPELASTFNVLNYARTDEHGLSVILADLLSPSGSHGQGTAFLQCFLDRFWEGHSADVDQARVRTEVATKYIEQNQGRIDIEIDLGDRIFAIENKPWAGDQPGQLTRYIEHLRKSGRSFRLMYLSGSTDRGPSEASIAPNESKAAADSGKLTHKSYRDLGAWIRDCLSVCRSERVSMFLRDLDRFIAAEFANERQDFTTAMVIEEAMAASTGVAAATYWAGHADDMRYALLAKLEEQLLAKFTDGPSGWSIRVNHRLDRLGLSSDDEAVAGIELNRRQDSDLMIKLAFAGRRCAGSRVGVWINRKEGKQTFGGIADALDSLGGGLSSSGPNWVWVSEFRPDNWWYDPGAWAAIANGQMAEAIHNRLCMLAATIEASGLAPMFESSAPAGTAIPAVRVSAYPRSTEIDQLLSASVSFPVELVVRIHSAAWQIRAQLVRLVARQVNRLIKSDEQVQGWQLDASADLRGKFAGWALTSPNGLCVGVEFQKYDCRGAIFGLSKEGVDGRTAEADVFRARLVDAGMETGARSPGWIWYRNFDPVDWFDDPETAVMALSGEMAERVSEVILRIALAVDFNSV